MVPVIFFALSLGIYQAYIQVAAVLAVLYLMLVLEQESIRKFWNRVLRFVIIFSGGLILYAVINALFLKIKNIRFNGHGIGSIENLKDFVETVSSAFLMSYKNVTGMAFRDICGVSTGRIMNGCWLLIMGLLGVIFLWQVLRRKKNIFLAILLLAMIPPAANLIRFVMFGREVDTLIIYSYCMIPVGLISQVETADLKTMHGAKGRLVRDVVILIGLLIVYRYIIQNNRNYVVSDIAKTEAISYYTTMIAQVKGLDGYSPSLPVYLLGKPQEDTTMASFSSKAYKGNVRGMFSLNGYVTMYSRREFINLYCGFSPKWFDDEDEELKKSAQVQQMPCYPTDGSIQIVDGVVVIKLGK